MSNKNQSKALAYSRSVMRKQVGAIVAMFAAAGVVFLSLYANSFMSLSPSDAVIANAIGVVGAATIVAIVSVWLTWAAKMLKAHE